MGGLDARCRDGAPLQFATRKALAILAILALKPGVPVARERLCGLLWANTSEPQARASLRQSLALLRKAIAPARVPGVMTIGDNVFLDPSGVIVDVGQFEAALGAQEDAVSELYGGDFLDGFHLSERAFEEWLAAERARLREQALEALERLLRERMAADRGEEAIHTALHLLRLDPLREELYRILMRLYWQGGRRATALAQFQQLAALLEEELGERPEPETEALHQEILRRRTMPAPAPAPQDAPPPEPCAPEESGGLKEVCLVMVELVGFLEHSLGADPEASQATIQAFYDRFERAVVRFGGRPEGLFNGVATACFGIPLAHGNDAERALSALQELAGSELSVKGAAAAGAVLWDPERERHSRLPAVTGRPLAAAQQLLGLARAGEILADGAIRSAAGKRFFFEALPGDDAWRLSGEREQDRGTRRARFVGREAELAQCQALLAACARARRGHTIYLRGPAGIGKTRLAEQVAALAERDQVAAHKVLVLDFGLSKETEAATLLACRLLGLEEEGPSAERRRAVAERTLDERVVGEEQRAPLYDLLALPPPAELKGAYDALGAELRDEAKQAVLVAVTKAACKDRPRLLIVEDIHWADRATLGHLAALSREIRHLPCLLLLTARRDGDPIDQAWRAKSDDAPLAMLDIAPLDEAAALALAGSFAQVSEQTAADCVARAQGNPFILEQLLRHAGAGEGTGLPHSLQSLIAIRLDALAPLERDVVEAAAVVGQRVAPDCLRHLCGSAEIPSARLIELRMLRPDGEALLFAHALLQEGAYGAIVKSQRDHLHRRAADWFSGRDATLVAQHLDRAGAPEAPAAYLAAAREQAGLHRYVRALELLERGIAIGQVAGDLFELNASYGELQAEAGSAAQAAEAYRIALTHARDDRQRCRAWIGVAVGVRVSDSFDDEAMALLDQAEAVALREGLLLDLAQIHTTRGNMYFPRGEIEACREAHEQAREFARRAGSPEMECRALSGLADSYYTQGRIITAHDAFEQCIALSREHGLKAIEVGNLAMLGDTYCYLNQLERSRGYYKAGIEGAHRIGHTRAEMLSCLMPSDLFPIQEVKAYTSRALELSRQLGARRFEAYALFNTAELLGLMGELAGAEETAEQAYEICLETGTAFVGPSCLGILARVARSEERRLWALEEAEAIIAAGCVSHNVFWFHHHGIETALELGDWSRAERYGAALEAFTKAEPLPWPDFVIARGRALAAHGRGKKSKALRAELERLLAHGTEVGRIYALPKLEAALA
ncbi:MAG: BTAD domain-containing putative transcriptional regulator [Pseudomonadota bacterium]